MSEFIGSRISLISKSDIKYVGTLHEINSETSTVALENVTSYGTEGRKGNPTQEIAGSDQVYEYIVFRGSDVKELSIVEAPKENKVPQVPNDPAILGSARPPQGQPQQNQQPPPNQSSQFGGPQPPFPPPYGYQQGPPPGQFQPPPPRFQGPGGPHGFPGQPGAVPGYNMGFGGPPPPNFGMGYGPPPGHGFPHHPPPGPFSPAQQNPIEAPGQQQAPVGSKHGTPQPPANQASQPPPEPLQQKPAEMSTTPAPPAAMAVAPPPPLDTKPSTAAATAPSAQPKPQAAKKAPNNRVAVPLPAAGPKIASRPPGIPGQQAPAAPPAKPQSYADATQAATAAVAAAMAKLAPPQRSSQQQEGGALDNLTQKVNQMRMEGGAPQRGARGGRPRGVGAPRGGRRDQKGVDVPKEDFDFESSNAKFNKQDLVKEAIASGSPIPSAANGETESTIENGHAESAADHTEEVIIPPQSTADKGYNKSTSFFDNISSDLKDRAEAFDVDGRALRREERSKNVETFGQGSVDVGYRGGYRGRGRGRGFGRGRGGFSRGGLEGGRGNAGVVRGRGRGISGEVGA